MALAAEIVCMSSTILVIDDVRARHGAHEVLGGVSLTVAAGEWFCVLGPNGVGKSTLLHCVAGRHEPAAGEIRIVGHRQNTQSTAAKRHLGFACAPEQLPQLLTGRQCLEVYAAAKELPSIDADVLALADRLQFTPFLDRYVAAYSLGTRQKLCILLALLGTPALIVLDEAFNGLDPASAMVVKKTLRRLLEERRCAVLLATHSLDMVEHHADRAALLLDGRVARVWGQAQLAALRKQGADALEEALAAVAVMPSA
jgi:ABC-2 type transport system ATP-binding protein